MAKITDLLTSTAHASDHITGTVVRDGKVVGFSESVRDGRATVVDRAADGTLDYAFSGPTPTNETGTRDTCIRLVQRWTQDGQPWVLVDVEPLPLHTDAVAENPEGLRVRFQVVRAMTETEFWHEADRQGRVARQHTVDGLVEQIRRSIEKKTKIPEGERSGLVLVLDALNTSALAFPDVVEAFRTQQGDWVRSLGFAQVWIVGQASGSTLRLDGPDQRLQTESTL